MRKTFFGYYYRNIAFMLFRNVMYLHLKKLAEKENKSVLLIVHQNPVHWFKDALREGWGVVLYSPWPVEPSLNTPKGSLVVRRKDGKLDYDSVNGCHYEVVGIPPTQTKTMDPTPYMGMFIVPSDSHLDTLFRIMDEERGKRLRSQSVAYRTIDALLGRNTMQETAKDQKSPVERIREYLGESNRIASEEQFLKIITEQRVQFY